MEKIVIISPGYPTDNDPEYAFIQPLARGFADMGIGCEVIAPQSITKILLHKAKRKEYKSIDKTNDGNEVTIYRPCYFSPSNLRICGIHVSSWLWEKAVKRCYVREKMMPDLLYGHFWESGMTAANIAKIRGDLPVVVVSGESKITVCEKYPQAVIEKRLPLIKGVICVSSKNELESRTLNLIGASCKLTVIPNGFDVNEFYPSSKEKAREKLGINQELFIGAFVGDFCERKGSERVIKAVQDVENVHLIMIGKGVLSCNDPIVFSGTVEHKKIVEYLNAADFFILPTLAEGCCNAIIEALACGLPIISSDLPFNDDILNDDNSIRVDPMDVESLAEAINRLRKDTELRKKMSQEALITAQTLTIEQRVKTIRSFLESMFES